MFKGSMRPVLLINLCHFKAKTYFLGPFKFLNQKLFYLAHVFKAPTTQLLFRI